MLVNEVEILLVEDNLHDAEMIIRSLTKVNLANKLHHVKDGAEAIDFLFTPEQLSTTRAAGPKLILLDIKMPKIDGFEVLKRVKMNENTKRIPVVILTSSKEEQDINMSYNLGVNSYVVKPVGFEEFVEVVSELGKYWLVTNQQWR
ncbi:response regulator [Mucilaginibacter hurinus]|uniref:Response regulator n=1 Tax=Mucilaginibacter hurinus TaxID=2201324 RepID=A0A367GLD1_9SPHI|nr:response regulator [Mucilaginibacter hurinus]RCH53656.1 response regulator [Mucilaginibacter hurinus]